MTLQEKLSFNTAISQMMIFINAVYKEEKFPREYAEGFIKLLSPVCPFIAEELWNMLGHDDIVAEETWPSYDEAKLEEAMIEIPIQVNGKLRGTIIVAKDASQEMVKEVAMKNIEIVKFIEGKDIVKEIYIPGRMFTIVVK